MYNGDEWSGAEVRELQATIDNKIGEIENLNARIDRMQHQIDRAVEMLRVVADSMDDGVKVFEARHIRDIVDVLTERTE